VVWYGRPVAVVLAVALFGVLLAGVELLQRRARLEAEVPRKVVHIGSAVIAAGLAFLLNPSEIVVLGFGFAVFMLLSRRFGLLPSVHGVTRSTRGEIFFPLGVAMLALVAGDRAQFVYGVLVLGLADGLAGVIGERYGSRRLSLAGSEKSVEGSATFFVVAAVIGAAALLATGEPAAAALAVAVLAAGVLTGVELSLRGGLDNLCVPVLAAILLQLPR
jgi:phytol kinase